MRQRILRSLSLFLLALVGAVTLQACSESTEKSTAANGDAVETGAKSALVLFPSDAPTAGSTVLLVGREFSGDCGVRITLDDDTKPLDTRAIGDTGSFSVQTEIPAAVAAGEHQLTAQGLGGSDCSEPSANVASVDIDVKPRLPLLLVDTIEARPGGTVQVTGRGFCGDPDCSPVMLLIDGAVVARDVDVGADGSFDVTAQVPAVDNAGEIMVVAVQTGAEGETLRGFGDLFVTVRPDVDRPVIL